MRSVSVGLILLTLMGCASASAPSAVTSAHPVEFSELVAKPEAYDQAIVRVRGTYTVGFEASVLRETRNGPQIWVELDPAYGDRTDPRVLKVFRGLLRRREGNGFEPRSARVVFVGRFHGVKPTQRFQGRTLTGGFGHLGSYDTKITVLAVEEARWVPW